MFTYDKAPAYKQTGALGILLGLQTRVRADQAAQMNHAEYKEERTC